MTPFFSVIIPTYNRVNVLFRAIESVLDQSFQDFDLWIVDDGSNDGTEERMRSFLDGRPELKNKIYYLKQKNSGVSSARNLAIQKSSGKWLTFLDSDDEWLPEKLNLQFSFINENPSIPVVHGEEIWIRRGRRVNQKNIHKKFGGWIFKKCLPLCLISPSAVAIRRDLFSEIGLFDPEFIVCEDYDLWLRITSLYEVGFIEDFLIYKYGGHEDQLSMSQKGMDIWRIKSMVKILKSRELTPENSGELFSELDKKIKILEYGIIKHQNNALKEELEKQKNKISQVKINSPYFKR